MVEGGLNEETEIKQDQRSGERKVLSSQQVQRYLLGTTVDPLRDRKIRSERF